MRIPLRRVPVVRTATHKVLPWLTVLDVLRATKAHWDTKLDPGDRRRLLELVRDSRGLPHTLSERDRRDLKRLVDRLDLTGLATTAAMAGIGARTGHRGRRR